MAVDYLPTLAEAPVAAAIPGELERRQRERIAAALMAQGGSGEPIQHWAQGLNRVAQGLVGGYQLGELRRQAAGEEARTQAILSSLGMPGGTGTPSQAAPGRFAEETPPAPAPAAPAPRPAMDPRAMGMAALSDPGVMASKPGVNRVLDISTAVPTGYTLPPDRGAKVASTASVVGDDEAVRRGLYDPPTTPGARPPNQPDVAALPGMTPAGATPVQTQSIRPSAQAAAAAPAAATSPATAEMALARALMANPPTRAAGLQMYMRAVEQMKPNFGFQVIGDTIYRTDPRGGQAVPLATAPQKPGLHSVKLPNGDEITVERDAQGRLSIPQIQGVSGGVGGVGTTPTTVEGPKGPVPIPENLNQKQRQKYIENVLQNTADVRSGKLTEGQSKDTLFTGKMIGATKMLTPDIEAEGLSLQGHMANKLPSWASGYVSSEKRQAYNSAQHMWIAGLLRKESGAAIQPPEWDREDRTFFPQPGETPAILARKRQARALAQELMSQGVPGDIGSIVREQMPDLPALGKPVPQGAASQGRARAKDKAGNIIEYDTESKQWVAVPK